MTRVERAKNLMLDWAKAIHEAIGIESPRVFIASFAVLGLLLFGFAGWIIDRAYRVKLRESAPKTAVPIAPIKSFEFAQQAALERAKELSSYAPSVMIACPENVSLLISSNEDTYLATFTKNGVTPTSNAFRLEVRDYRTFSRVDQAWREPPTPFNVVIGQVPVLQAGHRSSSFILLHRHKTQLEVGHRSMNEVLVWPPADSSNIETYRLGMKVYGLEVEKTIHICIRWDRGTDKIEFMDYNEATSVSQF